MGFIAVRHPKIDGDAVVSEQAFVHLEEKGWKRVDAKAEPAPTADIATTPVRTAKES